MDVQRAVCTSWRQPSPCTEPSARLRIKVTPCRRPPLSLKNGQTLEPIRLNFKGAKIGPKVQERPPGQNLVPKGQSVEPIRLNFKVAKIGPKVQGSSPPQNFLFFYPFWPDVQTHACTFCETCRHVSALAARGPGRRGVGGRKPPPNGCFETPWVSGFFYAPRMPADPFARSAVSSQRSLLAAQFSRSAVSIIPSKPGRAPGVGPLGPQRRPPLGGALGPAFTHRRALRGPWAQGRAPSAPLGPLGPLG